MKSTMEDDKVKDKIPGSDRKLSWINVMTLSNGWMLTRRLKRMSLKINRKNWRESLILLYRTCMVQVVLKPMLEPEPHHQVQEQLPEVAREVLDLPLKKLIKYCDLYTPNLYICRL